MSAAVNRGIIRAHEHGIVTSTSLMVRREASREAATYIKGHGTLGVGLHVDLGEWSRRNGRWEPVYIVTELKDRVAVRGEVRRQLERFRDLVGRNPTHIDSHQHVHREEPVRSAALEVATELDVPLRHFTSAVRYCGAFYGHARHGGEELENVTVPKLIQLVSGLESGITEMCCHPGDEDRPGEDYGAIRPLELSTLCDLQVRGALRNHKVRLRSFRELSAALYLGRPSVFAHSVQ